MNFPLGDNFGTKKKIGKKELLDILRKLVNIHFEILQKPTDR